MENEKNVFGHEVNAEVSNESKETSKKTIIIWISAVMLVIIGVAVTIALSMFSSSAKYDKANDLLNAKNYDKAIVIYQELGNYKDSKDKIDLCNFEKALLLIEEEKYVDAKNILTNLDANEEITKNLRLCNHMILYNYIMKNGTAYKGVHYIENPNTGLNIQVKNEDKTIRCYYEYYLGEAITMTTFCGFLLESPNVDVSYFLDTPTRTCQGEGVFYLDSYDKNLDNTPGPNPEGKCSITLQSGLKLWIDDIKYSPYLDLEIYDSGNEALDEMAALQYYVDFSKILEVLSDHIKYMDCGVSISDFGIVLK